MTLILGHALEPSQLDTPMRSVAGRTAQIGAAAAETAPQAGAASRDRRGPMRPAALSPARSRMTGWTLGAIFRGADAAALALIAVAGGFAFAGGALSPASFVPFVVGAIILIWSLAAVRAYDFAPRESLVAHLTRLAAGFGLAGIGLGLLLAGFKPATLAPHPFGLWFLTSFLLLGSLHALWWAVVRRWRAAGRLTPNIMVVGATANAERLIKAAMQSGEAAVLGVFDDRADRIPSHLAGVPVLGDTEALVRHRVMPFVDRIVITVPQHANARVRQLIERLEALPNQVMLFVDQGEAGRAAALSRIVDAPLAPVAGLPSDERRALVKRLQDLIVGALALFLAAPAMLLIALAIKLDSPGPVFFRQRRHGFNNEEILVWKFRSMRSSDAAAAASRQIRYDDERVTRVGRIIRRTSLDELPQLFNVLKGEMSLVGPRPHAIGMKTGDTESSKLVAEYAHRHRTKPGMTGWAAINGSRGPVDTPELVRRRVAYDIEYIERQSLMFDLMIMAQTIPCLMGDDEAVR
jgi:Undecaprenyl-phosphate glucose phosphotransferase